MIRITIATLCLLQFGCDKTVSTVPAIGYSLVWAEEFSGDNLDTDKWMHRMVNGMHGKSRIRSHCSVLDGDGHVVLRSQLVPDESEVGYEIESGMIATQGLHAWKYGLFEARLQFESAQGHHGAFWLQSKEYGKVTDDFEASGTEIDIIEYFGNNKLSQNLHWNAYGSKDKKAVSSGNLLAKNVVHTVDTDFHIYSLLWTPTENIFYIDGKETWRTARAVSKHDEYIILSVLASDRESKKIRQKEFPDSMVVDWVRVYQKQ